VDGAERFIGLSERSRGGQHQHRNRSLHAKLLVNLSEVFHMDENDFNGGGSSQ
jgi:hypothetical protein